jgi:hypothetical protein
MDVRLDGEKVFDSQRVSVEAGPVGRASVELSAAGLDGVLSVDLGTRTRRIRQSGLLRAQSRTQLSEKAAAISAFADGRGHTLMVDGQRYGEARLDSFEVTAERVSGAGVEAEYEIIYTQLQVQ